MDFQGSDEHLRTWPCQVPRIVIIRGRTRARPLGEEKLETLSVFGEIVSQANNGTRDDWLALNSGLG